MCYQEYTEYALCGCISINGIACSLCESPSVTRSCSEYREAKKTENGFCKEHEERGSYLRNTGLQTFSTWNADGSVPSIHEAPHHGEGLVLDARRRLGYSETRYGGLTHNSNRMLETRTQALSTIDLSFNAMDETSFPTDLASQPEMWHYQAIHGHLHQHSHDGGLGGLPGGTHGTIPPPANHYNYDFDQFSPHQRDKLQYQHDHGLPYDMQHNYRTFTPGLTETTLMPTYLATLPEARDQMIERNSVRDPYAPIGDIHAGGRGTRGRQRRVSSGSSQPRQTSHGKHGRAGVGTIVAYDPETKAFKRDVKRESAGEGSGP